MKKLKAGFYQRTDTIQIAKDLLGKVLVTNGTEGSTSGRIVETEAYLGTTDKASHAFGDRRTARTAVMYQPGGLVYVYLCYGIHHLFNVVTGETNIPHVVLIRALEPVKGLELMQQRTGLFNEEAKLTAGPGKLSKAMGLKTAHSGCSLFSNKIYIIDDGYSIMENEIASTPRIGVDYAGTDAFLPYRFLIRDHPCVSKRQNQKNIKPEIISE